jgi:hypothetical protein
MYTTYENRNNPHITIHQEGYGQIRRNGGIGRGEHNEKSNIQNHHIRRKI